MLASDSRAASTTSCTAASAACAASISRRSGAVTTSTTTDVAACASPFALSKSPPIPSLACPVCSGVVPAARNSSAVASHACSSAISALPSLTNSCVGATVAHIASQGARIWTTTIQPSPAVRIMPSPMPNNVQPKRCKKYASSIGAQVHESHVWRRFYQLRQGLDYSIGVAT